VRLKKRGSYIRMQEEAKANSRSYHINVNLIPSQRQFVPFERPVAPSPLNAKVVAKLSPKVCEENIVAFELFTDQYLELGT